MTHLKKHSVNYSSNVNVKRKGKIVKIVKLYAGLFANHIFISRNHIKKKGKNDNANYRPVSILPNLSKIYEKIMYQQ